VHTATASPLLARRQQRTWTAIHDAAASQAIEHGLESVTVARIAEIAEVSPRTFFNYFDSKEDAIVGVRTPVVTAAALAALRDSTGDVPLLRVARLVTDVAETTIGPGVDLRRRRRLAQQHPHLRTRLTQVFTDARRLVIARLVEESGEPWDGIAGLPAHPLEARALVLLAGAVVTFAWTADPDRIHTDREGALTDAIVTFRKVTSTAL